MAKKLNSSQALNPAGITKPIPLLAFIGTLLEGIIGVIAYTAQSSLYFPILAGALILLPFFLIVTIFRLITKHHDKLYAPADFANPDHFVELIHSSSRQIEKFGASDSTNIFVPFQYSNPLPQNQQMSIKQSIATIEPFLEGIKAEDFVVLHSWYNSIGQHKMALLCIDIAIAKGSASSRNFAFRSASLRKLGRLLEAKHSALIAIELDQGNLDASYNLSKTYALMDNRVKALEAAKVVFESGHEIYVKELRKFLQSDNN